MNRNSILLVSLGALSLAACQKPGAPAAVDTAAVERDLKSREADWMAAYAAHDGTKLIDQYAEDAALANPGVAIITDSAARAKAIAGYAADPLLKVDFASDKIGVATSGDLAYTRGHYTMTSTDPATKAARQDSGSYLTVWKKQIDGDWKAVEDFITPGPPTAPRSNAG